MPPLKKYIYQHISDKHTTITLYAYDDSRANKQLEDIVKDVKQFKPIKK